MADVADSDQQSFGLNGGTHVMKLAEDTSGANGTVGNLNYFTLTATISNPPPVLAHRYSFEGAPGTLLVSDFVGTATAPHSAAAAITGSGKLNLLGSNGYVDFPNGLVSA